MTRHVKALAIAIFACAGCCPPWCPPPPEYDCTSACESRCAGDAGRDCATLCSELELGMAECILEAKNCEAVSRCGESKRTAPPTSRSGAEPDRRKPEPTARPDFGEPAETESGTLTETGETRPTSEKESKPSAEHPVATTGDEPEDELPVGAKTLKEAAPTAEPSTGQPTKAPCPNAKKQPNGDTCCEWTKGLFECKRKDKDKRGGSYILVPERACFRIGCDPAIHGTGTCEEDEVSDNKASVCLSPFMIDTNEITQADYRKYLDMMGEDPPPELQDWNPGGIPKHPVTGLTWYEARDYCQWLGGDLPTEAQWELAARGLRTHKNHNALFPWGNDTRCSYANYFGCLGRSDEVGTHEEGRATTRAYDLSGNVWEWVFDAYDPGFYDSLSPEAEDPHRVGDEQHVGRVVRGGSYGHSVWLARSTNRDFVFSPLLRVKFVGARCAYPVQAGAKLPAGFPVPDRFPSAAWLAPAALLVIGILTWFVLRRKKSQT